MNLESKNLLQDALALPETDRAEIAGVLLQSLEPSPDPEIERAWRVEVAQRVAEFDSGSVEAIPWEEVRDRLHSRLNAQRSS